MYKVVFTHNRPDMLARTLDEVKDAVVLGSHPAWDGKRMFYAKWQEAVRRCLASKSNWFLFLPDDYTNINLKVINKLTQQGWDNAFLAFNVANCGRTECWGRHKTNQPDIVVDNITFKEVGFVDCSYLTNRTTLQYLKIEEMPPEWWDRPDKSSGVGFQNTNQFRRIGVKMMMPTPTLAKHGAHESVMHGSHRLTTPLIAK